LSIYKLKAGFQTLLRPLVRGLYGLGITANQVTVFACLVSVLLGLGLYWLGAPRAGFLLIPGWMFLRMALNAIDGILAREFGQQSKLGALLNELTDVLADAALLLPFALIAPLGAFSVWAVVVLAGLSEFAGALGPGIGATRRYDGPMGKSDRAFVFGVLALWIGLTEALPNWSTFIVPVIALLIAVTIFNRIHRALKEAG
jgi:CDP-diacylglycerol---glycerol-3-phosphate 3-phosphatidyltransferase